MFRFLYDYIHSVLIDIDVMGWARETFGHDITVNTCGFNKTVISTFCVPITVDGNIITSYCPETAVHVAFTLLEMLIGSENTAEVKTAMGYSI